MPANLIWAASREEVASNMRKNAQFKIILSMRKV